MLSSSAGSSVATPGEERGREGEGEGERERERGRL